MRQHRRRKRVPGTAEYVTNPAAGLSMALNRYGTVAATPYVPTDQRLEGPQGVTFRTRTLHRPLNMTATDTDWYASRCASAAATC